MLTSQVGDGQEALVGGPKPYSPKPLTPPITGQCRRCKSEGPLFLSKNKIFRLCQPCLEAIG